MVRLIKSTLRSVLFLNSSIATLDQAMLSALNFLISIILIKTVSKVEFGYYAIAFSISQLLIWIHNSIVNTPLAVLLVEKNGSLKQKYSASLCYGQFIAILPAACLGLAGAGLLYYWDLDATKASIVAAVSLSAIGILFREFLRALFFAEETPLQVLKLDAYYSVLFLFLIIVGYLFNKISIAAIFIMNGASGLLISLHYVRKRQWQFHKKSIRESYRENWKFGKWALLGVIVTHMQNYSYLYLLGALLGSAAVADVSAARLLLAPVLLAQIGWGKIAVPHGSKLRENNQIARFFKELMFASLIAIVGIAAYIIILLSLSGVLSSLLFTEKYVNSFEYLPYWGGFFIIGFLATSASYGLQVLKQFSFLAKFMILTMLITVGCSYFFIQWYGIKGGLAALILGGVLTATGFWYFFTKNAFPKPKRQQPASVKKDFIRRLLEQFL